jgi:hypothetical protein
VAVTIAHAVVVDENAAAASAYCLFPYAQFYRDGLGAVAHSKWTVVHDGAVVRVDAHLCAQARVTSFAQSE